MCCIKLCCWASELDPIIKIDHNLGKTNICLLSLSGREEGQSHVNGSMLVVG